MWTRLLALTITGILLPAVSWAGYYNLGGFWQSLTNSTSGQWKWVSGANLSAPGEYYTSVGVANFMNKPTDAWGVGQLQFDSSSRMYLSLGYGPSVGGNTGTLNDLWRWDGTNWTYLRGSGYAWQSGVYTGLRTSSPTALPMNRSYHNFSMDNAGNMWLFGGQFDSGNGLNDLWKWDGTNWNWMSGDNIMNTSGTYGSKGVAAAANRPGARCCAAFAAVSPNNLLLFGGWGRDSAGNFDDLNDLWKFDGTNWTWLGGSNIGNGKGTYGSRGVAAAANIPGAREGMYSYYNTSTGTFWIFGGEGYSSSGSLQYMNDLWKWDGANWTWVSGSNSGGSSGKYGSRGVAATTNVPGARDYGAYWSDNSNYFWVWGGWVYDTVGAQGYGNDLWKFDGTNWTWMNGSNTKEAWGTYGSKGVAGAGNSPGGRKYSGGGFDKNNNLAYFFGGLGRDSMGVETGLMDLWKYNPTTNQWAWIYGYDSAWSMNLGGFYGTMGVASSSNRPAPRDAAAMAIGPNQTLYVYGGESQGIPNDNFNIMGDLWKFDGTNWTWLSGGNTNGEGVVNGVKGVTSSSNRPGSRYNHRLFSDTSGNIWLFGGDAYANAGAGALADMWKWDGANWTWMSGSNIANSKGTYGVRLTASVNNTPGGRDNYPGYAQDDNGDFWIFGGYAYDSTGSQVDMNDLWKFDPVGVTWTWVTGSNAGTPKGTYGSMGVVSATSMPGARKDVELAPGPTNTLYMFGGYGWDSAATQGDLNDLWQFSIGTNQWMWVRGSNGHDKKGTYGSKGVSAFTNNPGGRHNFAMWSDLNHRIYVMGGQGYDSAGTYGYLNDLWKFDGANWAWIAGDNTANRPGIYGSLGVQSTTNTPGARWLNPGHAVDYQGRAWFFGGFGYDTSGWSGDLNDLWIFY